MRRDGHEQVTHVRDESTGLEAIVAVHDTSLGPALGGTRFMNYPSEDAALVDVLRLSRAMTYKAATADLDLGGGKAVILGDPTADKSEAALRAFGRAVDDLDGSYITTEDMNTEVADMDVVADETSYVVGTSEGLGDPSPVTAYGVLHGIRASLDWRYGDESLTDVEVVVQGAGKVGSHLAEQLVEADASVTIADPNPEARWHVQERVDGEVEVVDAAEAIYESCDVLAPCAASHLALGDGDALGEAIPNLQCEILAGSANNVLGDHDETVQHARTLADEKILYAPDYVVNAGGLILTAHDWHGSDRQAAYRAAEAIQDRLTTMFERADSAGVTPLEAANRYAEERFQ